MEQAPNTYAFSVGNADRIFEPYRRELTREEASELFKHFLVFYNVGDRSWAISQNILIGGRDVEGNDLSGFILSNAQKSPRPQTVYRYSQCTTKKSGMQFAS